MNDTTSRKIDESKLDRALEEAGRQMRETNQKFIEMLRGIRENWREQQAEYKSLVSFLKDQNNEFDFSNLLSGGYKNQKKQISDKYSALRASVDSDDSLSPAQKEHFKNSYNFIEDRETKKAYDDSFLGKTTEKMSKEFSAGLQEMITGYKSFSDVMESMTTSLTDFMIKQFTDKIMDAIFSEQTMSAASDLFGGLLNWGKGGLGSAFSFIGGLFKRHSGGVIPSGANYSLPGTQEQLALLKGGERVLSPSENVSYENQGGSSPVIVNSFNIKAWDSKDVKQYLLENRQLLNQITYEGIKNNNAHLRHIVQNA